MSETRTRILDTALRLRTGEPLMLEQLAGRPGPAVGAATDAADAGRVAEQAR